MARILMSRQVLRIGGSAQDGNAIRVAQSRRRHDVADPRVGPPKRIVRT